MMMEQCHMSGSDSSRSMFEQIGDYITIVSDLTGGNVAYSATFNFNPTRGQHEQDVEKFSTRLLLWIREARQRSDSGLKFGNQESCAL